MERNRCLIVVAAGKGMRMGGDVPKQFVPLMGKAVLHRTIEKFASACPDLKVLTVLNEDYIPYWKEYCLTNAMVVPQTLVKGGITRFHSVRNAIEKIPDGCSVAVHDGVRPFVSAALIERLFNFAEDSPAVVPVLPCTDTLKALDRCGEDYVARHEAVDRSVLFGAQTPQVFHSEVLRKAYSLPYCESFTDDASVVEKSGVPIRYVDGEKLNFKLTTPEDMKLAEALLASGRL